MKTTKIHLILLAAFAATPILASCATKAGNVAAGAATAKAIDNRQEEQKKEDYVKAKGVQKANRNR